ncbi:MAG: cation:proton antiporter, partial [Verrucomicrobiales bacterium]|nr:cation:proton antiporter [Verrucomicrobiales bacterium]
MTDTAFLQNLGLIIVAAALFSLIGRRVRLPSIVAFLLAGLFLGPVTGLVAESEELKLLTESGIVLLLFLVGLELTVDRIREVGKVAIIAGSIQILLTSVISWGICRALGFDLLQSVLLAAALTISSTVVVVTILVERDESSTSHGQAAIGILLVQDVFVILLLTILTGLDGGEETDASAITTGLAKAFGGMLALVVMMLVAARYVLPSPFSWAG